MGREIKRVVSGFDWPLKKVWSGYVNPIAAERRACAACEGSGHSPQAARLSAMWYGRAPFHPRETGSELVGPQTPEVAAFAAKNVERCPAYYGSGPQAIEREARRLSDVWNLAWSHHLSQQDVQALWDEDRLTAFGRPNENGGERGPAPLARDVNAWSLGGFGHDSINHAICVRARCEREGAPYYCAQCDGEGSVWASEKARAEHENWAPSEPPSGPAYQLWETVSEGSPVSPAFDRPEELARWLASFDGGESSTVSYAKWLAFIHGPGWAPSVVIDHRGARVGVEAS